MDHISKIITENKTHPSSPTTGVSQSKFLSPCRRVGLKRSSNKFVLKFKEITNPKESIESAKNVDNKCGIFITANDPSNTNKASCIDTQMNKAIIKDEKMNKKGDCCVKNVNETVIIKNLCDNTEFNHADVENEIYNNNFLEDVKKKKTAFKKIDVKKEHNICQTVNKSICDKKNNVRNCASPDLMDLKNENILKSCDRNLPIGVHKNEEIVFEKTISNDSNIKDPTQCCPNRCTTSNELCNLVPHIVDNTKKISSSTNKSTNSYSDNTGKNSSPCDSLKKTDINCSDDLKMECSLNVNSTPCITNLRTKTVKRFKNPMKTNFAKKLKIETDNSEFSDIEKRILEFSDIEKRISEKEKKIAELKVTIANSTKHDINHLESLISKWRTGCQEALAELLAEIKRRGSEDYDLNKLITELNIPHQLVQYSETDQDFY